MELDQEESREQPRLRRPPSKNVSLPRSLSSTDGNNTSKKQKNIVKCNVSILLSKFLIGLNFSVGEMEVRRMGSRSSSSGLDRNADSSLEVSGGVAPKRGMVLPFTPLAMSFDSVNYFVDMPAVRFLFLYFTLC